MQRSAKTYRASAADTGEDMRTYQFFKKARIALEETDNKEAAFYFNQVEDWLKSGKGLHSKPVSRILGV